MNHLVCTWGEITQVIKWTTQDKTSKKHPLRTSLTRSFDHVCQEELMPSCFSSLILLLLNDFASIPISLLTVDSLWHLLSVLYLVYCCAIREVPVEARHATVKLLSLIYGCLDERALRVGKPISSSARSQAFYSSIVCTSTL